MAAKIFEVGDVLPATTQLKISWESGLSSFLVSDDNYRINCSAGYTFIFVGDTTGEGGDILFRIDDIPLGVEIEIYRNGWNSPYTDYSGGHNYIVIDISSWNEAYRTIGYIDSLDCLYWEDLNASSGYTITFNSNGGTTISDIEEATELPTLPIPTKSGYTFAGWYYDDDFTTQAYAEDELEDDVTLYAKWILNTYTITYNSNGGSSVTQTSNATQLPSPLPTTTKSGYTFVAWYYESDFQTRAKAGDTLESNVTLYAKWHNLGSLFTEIANAIRSKDGTSENIRDVDFGERVKQIQGAIELTQAQYDALGTKDANTYYLIVEVE